MIRRIPFSCALTVCATLLCASLALAAAPPAKEVADMNTTAQPATDATAGQALKDPAAAVEALNKSMRASEQQTQAAAAAMRSGSKPAQSAPAAKAGGGKVIYGDIIIHK